MTVTRGRPATLATRALAALCAGWACATSALAEDILGPLGPMRPSDSWAGPALTVLAVVLGVVAAAVAARQALARRELPEPAPGPDRDGAVLLAAETDELPAADYYRALLAAVRAAVDGAADGRARALTARETVALVLAVRAEADAEAWGRLCARAEWACYGGGRVDLLGRREDRELLAATFRRAAAATPAAGTADEGERR